MGREIPSWLNATFSLKIWQDRRNKCGEAALRAFWSPCTNAPRMYPAGRTNPIPAVKMAYFCAMPFPAITLGGVPLVTGLNTDRFITNMYTDVKTAKAMSSRGTRPLDVSTSTNVITCNCTKENEPKIPCLACRCSACACTHPHKITIIIPSNCKSVIIDSNPKFIGKHSSSYQNNFDRNSGSKFCRGSRKEYRIWSVRLGFRCALQQETNHKKCILLK